MVEKITYALTIYAIKESFKDIEDIIKDDSATKEIPSLGTLHYSQSKDKSPKWLDLFSNINIDSLFSATASAILLLKVENRFFAITFGPGGRHFLKKGVTEERFGLVTTLNSVKPESLKSIDTKTLESEGIQTRIQSAKPIAAEDFGLDIEKDLVRGIVGKSKVEALGETLVGKDSLRLSIKCDSNDLKDILKICLKQYLKEDYKKNFSWIDNLKEIRDPLVIEDLNSELVKEINKASSQKLWLTIPEILDWIDHGGFKYSNRKTDEIHDDIHIDTLKNFLNLVSVSLEDLKNNHVCRFSKSNEYEQDNWRVYECIYFECNKKDSTFFLTGGKWYEVRNSLVSTVNDYWNSISNKKHGIDFINYDHKNENEYNKSLAKKNSALCMDQKIIQIEGRSKFEFCDVYALDRKLIHIKRYSGSSVLSHLFNQGYVSAEFLFDPEFRNRINSKIKEKKFQIKDVNNRPNTNGENYTIIYGIVSNAEKDFDLPFFSKMTLMHVTKNLINRGYEVSIVKINNNKEK